MFFFVNLTGVYIIYNQQHENTANRQPSVNILSGSI